MVLFNDRSVWDTKLWVINSHQEKSEMIFIYRQVESTLGW